MNTKIKGDISVAKVIASLIKKGYAVSLPFGDCQRYDLILDDGKNLSKIQVKTSRIADGAVEFNSHSIVSRAGGKIEYKTYENDVDGFAVYSPELDKTYLIPMNVVKHIKKRVKLRVEHPKNNQTKKIIWAKPFEI